ncbi:MAG: SDR family oxidoreductase [Deltaproteobacteria bacterium]|nr:SDR family oxidoreductase [Deltaproteobacteria bacterium]MCB9789067.1 SDR family oxidoreductase [Deltaproteobacteria bacterium]
MNQFDGRCVVVTGGTGALGSGIVGALLDGGAEVHVPWRDRAELDRSPHAHRAGFHARGPVDLSDESAVASFFASLPAVWASIHTVGGFAMAPLCETSAETFRRMHELNVVSCFLCCREAVRRMRGGGYDGGRIVNVGARAAQVSAPGMVAYTSAKAAVAALTTSLADELRHEGIFVNAVMPSIIDTPQNREAMADADHALWPTPTAIARTVVFLASPDNRVTHGALVPVYGAA